MSAIQGEVIAPRNEVAEQPTDNVAAMMAMIERAVRDPSIDINKLERMFALHERAQAKQAETAYYAAMAVVQSKVPKIIGRSKNKHTGSFYADLVAVNDTALPIITECGFSLSFGEDACPKEGHIRVICDCSHRNGHTRRYHWDAPIDDVGIKGTSNKTPIQAQGSTFSYAQRYLTKLIFNLRIEGEDKDGNNGKPPVERISEEQVKELEAKLKKTGANRAQFLDFFEAEEVSDIRVTQIKTAHKMLDERSQRRGRR